MNNVRVGTTVVAQNTVTTPITTNGDNPQSATWRLLDNYGTLWGEGMAMLLDVPQAMDKNYVYRFEATVNVPDTMPPSDGGQTYMLVWEVTFTGHTTVYTTSEDVTVVGANQQAYGPNNGLVGLGGDIVLTWVTAQPHTTVDARIMLGNKLVREVASNAVTHTEVEGGHKYSFKFDTGPNSGVYPSLEPYLVAWSGTTGDNIDSELGTLYVVTPTMWSAATDIEQFLQRSYQTVAGQHDLVFTPADLMMFLRLGRDHFNALFLPTNYTMTNAKGPIRNGWLACAKVMACRSEYLAEGMKAFDFTGQAVTLSADRTQYWESLASQIEGTFDNAIRPLKTNLSRRGQTEGDGSQDGLTLARRAMGAVGVTVSPVANLRGLHGSGAHWYGGWLRRTW